MNLRPYQVAAIGACWKAWREHRRILLVLPTGAGKTIVASAIIERVVNRGHRVLFLAHREELLSQTCDKLRSFCGIEAELEKGEHRASREASVVVASVQSLQGARLKAWPANHFGLVIVDECHHAAAASFRSILDHFQGKTLGMTATPDRSDKKNLGAIFDALAFEVGLAELIEAGFLSRPVVRTLPLKVDLQGVRTSAGDYQAGDLGEAIRPFLEEILTEALPILRERKSLVFAPLIETSRLFAQLAADAGLRAEHIDGTSQDRKAILERYSASGRGSLLSCAMLLCEGFDEPSADCLLNLRPTRSRSLYAQLVGRILRAHPGKTDALILDPLWQRLNLIKPASLVAGTAEDAREMEGRDGDLLTIAEEVEQDRLRALRETIEKNRGRQSGLFDPIQLGLMLNDLGVVDYEPVFEWHKKPATEAQLDALSRMGINIDAVQDRGHAAVLMDSLTRRMDAKMATPKQIRLMARLGHPNPSEASFADAGEFIESRLRKPAVC